MLVPSMNSIMDPDLMIFVFFAACTTRCEYYMNNTMNFNKKGYCDVDHSTGTLSSKLSSTKWNSNSWYNNEAACTAAGFKWYMISHSDNLYLSK
jgi:hypothetical protein